MVASYLIDHELFDDTEWPGGVVAIDATPPDRWFTVGSPTMNKLAAGGLQMTTSGYAYFDDHAVLAMDDQDVDIELRVESLGSAVDDEIGFGLGNDNVGAFVGIGVGVKRTTVDDGHTGEFTISIGAQVDGMPTGEAAVTVIAPFEIRLGLQRDGDDVLVEIRVDGELVHEETLADAADPAAPESGYMTLRHVQGSHTIGRAAIVQYAAPGTVSGWFYGAEDTASETFPTDPEPDYPYSRIRTDQAEVSEAEDGTKRSLRKFALQREVLVVSYPLLIAAEIDTLWDFYQTVRGQTTSFTVADPDGGAALGNFRFVDPTMSKDRFEAVLYETGLVLIQVFEFTQ